MLSRKIVKLYLAIIVLYSVSFTAFADTIPNPCAGPSALLNLVDRPTVGDSACAIPFKEAVLEAGYQYQWLTHSAGYEQNFPEAELRIGLPANNELSILLPNSIHQSKTSHSGSTATVLGLKHEIGYNRNWLGAAEIVITLPDGSSTFGSKGTGAALNGIVSYTINSAFNLTFMFGATTQTESSDNGGQRFNSLNPDLILTYSGIDKWQLFAEVYGQSKTGPHENSGFNADAGFLYLIKPNIEFDMEVGQRLSGNLNGFNHYIGTGFGILFS